MKISLFKAEIHEQCACLKKTSIDNVNATVNILGLEFQSIKMQIYHQQPVVYKLQNENITYINFIFIYWCISYPLIYNMEILHLKILYLATSCVFVYISLPTGRKAYYNNLGFHFMLYKYSTINYDS